MSFYSLVFKILGWKVDKTSLEKDKNSFPKKYLLLCEPHTSNWDFIYGLIAMKILKIHIRFVIKKEIMIWPLSIILKSLGAIPIDRKKQNNHESNVDIICKAINNMSSGAICISPKGTRSKTDRYKTGFFYIAKKTNIPVCMCYIDYKTKEIGLSDFYYVKDDVNIEIQRLHNFFDKRIPKYINQGVLK